MTAHQELIDYITQLTPEQAEKVLPALLEAIDMMDQGKSNEEILEHFGIST